MQRENRILKRSGFALIMAIFVILIIAGIMSLMVNISATSSQRTTNDYLHEQAMLLTKSATEYALLRISGVNRNFAAAGGTPCLTGLNLNYPDNAAPLFNINITIQYIGLLVQCGPNIAGYAPNYINTVLTPESIGTVLLDVTVSTAGGIANEPIRYHRRTLQKL